ncbi:hypothetical protein CAPTEDRAFT_199999 [Capitella teleta]|uniref:WSC domain-containing protein n=1 Tax=Capitella teleta TaxID=283909 RepID=R7U971_CAPTE|nr:hypothetical protein CAPTEDRAFT_199999 [Capitella teleta]|eukprot:ELT99680.1 hypothetical protein CAPTEDRAFT_199999 [Capitella teleta]
MKLSPFCFTIGKYAIDISDQELHQNQGCFFTRNVFHEEYVLESSVGDQSGCISHCINNGYAYSGLTKDSSASFLCHCGHELPSRDERDDEKCRAECPNGKLICGYKDYARIIANEASTIEFFTWRPDGGETSRKWCAALQFERTSKPYSPSLTQSDCSLKKRAVCVTDHRQKAYVRSEPLSWFEAQDFCHDIEVTHATHTVRLSKDTADDVLDSDEIDKTEEYWTQLSSLHLISKGSSDSLGDLPWADGYPQPDNKICIRAQKNNDKIELITADCDDRLSFICVSSDELTSTSKPESTFVKPVMSHTVESTTVLITTSIEQSDNSLKAPDAISTDKQVQGILEPNNRRNEVEFSYLASESRELVYLTIAIDFRMT